MAQILSGERAITTQQMHDRASRAANGLTKLGLAPGDVFALVLRNDFAFFEASSATGIIGAYPTPVNWHATPTEARYLFEDSGARAMVIHADLYAALKDVIPKGVAVFVVPTPPEIVAAYGLDLAQTEFRQKRDGHFRCPSSERRQRETVQFN